MAQYHTHVLSTPQSFTCFPLLPCEIRGSIWESVALQPRNLDIWPVKLGRFNFIKNIRGAPMSSSPVWRYVTTRPPPAILHATHESREVGLQHYVLSFKSSSFVDERHGLKVTLPARIYFNIASDFICLMGGLGTAGDRMQWGELSTQRLWGEFEQRIFGITGSSVALNIATFFETGIYDEQSLLSYLYKQNTVLLYYLEDSNSDNLETLQRSLVSSTFEFADLDEGAINGPGVCSNLKSLVEQQDRDYGLSLVQSEGIGMEGWEAPPAVKWVTLVVNGEKVGLQ
ncbi:uncharacterized protein PAC_08427 [Phialocephala subalpina]|uniref:2EXR domain-containing protein n=1 Tax=Phialocephala subalpina TaxID=576137 RepID=A0A1L7X0I2_9HELO|nr:uncharacterized protein PAC_08427 [Phialocephala subalpina]